jgi:DNA-binding transcriptional LysR family regulator
VIREYIKDQEAEDRGRTRVKLFNRERQRLIITEAGRQYLAVVRDAFDRLAVGTERLVQRQTSGVLTISTSPDFAAKWLVHRLARFVEAHPGLTSESRRLCTMSTSRAKMSTSRFVTAMAIGRGSTFGVDLGALVRRLQPQARYWTSPSQQAFRRAQISADASRRQKGLVAVA